MKAITQNERYEFSKAKKVLASVVAAALVVWLFLAQGLL
mgnify:CR=1 FL=1